MAEIKGWKFPIDVDKTTGRIMTVEDNDNVKQSVKIILQTQKFERKMRSNFGTDVNSFMFENVDYTLMNNLAKEIKKSINKWEDHVEKLSVAVTQSLDEVGSIKADISFISDISPMKEKVTETFNIDNLSR